MQNLIVAASPKKFDGPTKTIQDNAIKSWSMLFGSQNICLFGDEETRENSVRLGTKYAKPEYSDTNVPLLNSILKISRSFETKYILFINSDIILMEDFKKAFEKLDKISKKSFMLVGRRTNLDLNLTIDFNSNWQNKLLFMAETNGELAQETLIDYFLFPTDRFKNIPPLRIGRAGIDNILLYWAVTKEKIDLIDVTPDVCAIHQNHDYSHFLGGKTAMYTGKDSNINFELGGGHQHHYFFISECNLILNNGNIRRKHNVLYYLSKRYIFDVMPAVHPTFIFMTKLKSLLRRIKGFT